MSAPTKGRDPDPSPPGAAPPAPGTRGQLPVVIAVVVGLVGLLIVLVVARSGPTDDFNGHLHKLPTRPPQSSSTPPKSTSPPPSTSGAASSHGGTDIFGLIVKILLILVAVAVAGFVIAYLVRTFRSIDFATLRRRPPVGEVEEAPEDTIAALAQAAERGASYEISRGVPRDAIVACWQRLENVVAGAGLERLPSETAAEFTGRLLATWDVDTASLSTLADLYREARFSRHEMSEDDRARAGRSLREIGDQLFRRMR